jgi:hypothetical protein
MSEVSLYRPVGSSHGLSPGRVGGEPYTLNRRVNGERRLRFTGFAETLEATDAFANGPSLSLYFSLTLSLTLSLSLDIYTYICMYAYICIYTYVYVYIYIYMCIYGGLESNSAGSVRQTLDPEPYILNPTPSTKVTTG